MHDRPVTDEQVRAHDITDEEFELIVTHLGRRPNLTELGIFCVMWSEHCSYKSSRVHLAKFPKTSPRVLVGPGENAGAIDIGDGLAVIFKMESHNHPSYVEPYQGAATGVGGILRDIFTMGARPVASLNSLWFGSPDHARTAYLVNGVVAGIAGYGNCIGVPTVGGEVHFHPSYNGNVLVNVFNLGIVKADKIFMAGARGIGNPVYYVGSRTGRDGIHGASLLASSEFSERTEQMRPTVQVGDPFTEKLLLEACLELMDTDAIAGIQDMGAAGLTCSTTEMADRAGNGIEIDLDRVPLREQGMTPYDIMLSESQERMLIVAHKGKEKEVERVFRKWDLEAAEVGLVTDDGFLTVKMGGQVAARIPVRPLVSDCPAYRRPARRPDDQDELLAFDPSTVRCPADLGSVLLSLLGSPALCSREWIYRQYDHMILTNTVVRPGSDAAVIRIKGSSAGIAMSVQGNSRYCRLDPYMGAAAAVAEAARNLACAGAEPVGITDCLNFGSPEVPAVMWQFEQAVDAICEACLKFGTPVVSGNVSFYNEAPGSRINPTPTIGMVGILADVSRHGVAGFLRDGDRILLLGRTDDEALGGSEYLSFVHGIEKGRPPRLDLDAEVALGAALRAAIAAGLVRSAHDVSDGGLAVCIAESCMTGPEPRGARVRLDTPYRADAALFGEPQGVVVVSADPANASAIAALCESHGVPVRDIGDVGGSRVVIELDGSTAINVKVKACIETWKKGFPRLLGK